nr:4-amino-4-deoxy-L-arabinose transferase [Nocardioides panaciterrulae]
MLCIDGPAGSGKTTLAAAVAAGRTDTPVVHMDDLYDGWQGLPRLPGQLAALLAPLTRGEPGRYRRYDWHAGSYAETVTVRPAPLLVLEGVGAGARSIARLITLLVWVTAPPELRLRRGLERDGASMAPQWERWMRDEAEHLARERTAARADVVVDGS